MLATSTWAECVHLYCIPFPLFVFFQNAGLLLGAMEDMTFATDVSNVSQEFPAFSNNKRVVVIHASVRIVRRGA